MSMVRQAADGGTARGGVFAPLRTPAFRSTWLTSLASNFGQLILGVGAAWEMTRLTNSAEMVALVQTALMLPLMLVAVPAGAIADMFDRRAVAICGLSIATLMAALLTAIAFGIGVSPPILLGFCFAIGAGVALYTPAWQASIREQVPAAHLPAAVALGAISFNLARSVGPALGGVIVLLLGARAAFAINMLCYVPMLLVFLAWKHPALPRRLPPERIDRAIVSGALYAVHSPPIRMVLARTLIYGLLGAAVVALTPIVAHDLLGGDAGTYGLLLGVYGVGAVGGALATGAARERYRTEQAASLCVALNGLAIVVVGWSRSLPLTCAALIVAGGAWMLLVSLLTVGVQVSAPRWVTARALSWYQAALTGGIALGAWIWGTVAGGIGVGHALMVSGGLFLLTPLLGRILPLPHISSGDAEPLPPPADPDVALPLTARSGPVTIEVDYEVDPEEARDFYNIMREVQQIRRRNGAFGWTIARDVADPRIWTERYRCPTWGDYLHMRSRFTQGDRALHDRALAFHRAGPLHVRRKLERPFGSVRWRADTPDPHAGPEPVFTP